MEKFFFKSIFKIDIYKKIGRIKIKIFTKEKKVKKLLYGILAFIPLVELILSLIALIAGFVMLGGVLFVGANMIDPNVSMIFLWIGIAGIVLGILLCIAVTVIFCIHVKRNEDLDGSEKGVWIGSLIGLMFLSFPVYWWKCIR